MSAATLFNLPKNSTIKLYDQEDTPISTNTLETVLKNYANCSYFTVCISIDDKANGRYILHTFQLVTVS